MKRNYMFAVVRTAFHGGGIVSRHYTLSAALKKAHSEILNATCECGCFGVVPLNREALKSAKHCDYCNHTLYDDLPQYSSVKCLYALCK